MTDAEYHLLRQSAHLCEERLKLADRMHSLSAAYTATKNQIAPDPMQKANQKAKNVVDSRRFHKFSHVLLALLATSVLCVAIAFAQIQLFPSVRLLGILNPACSLSVGILVYVALYRRHKEKCFLQYRAHYQNEYVQQSEEAERKCAELRIQIRTLYAQYIALERQMQDPTQCCISRQHWDIGPRLFQIVDTGAARSLDAAIRFYYQPKKAKPQPAKRHPVPHPATQPAPQAKTAAENARWRELEKMMAEQNASSSQNLYQFVNQIAEAAEEYILIQELFD